MEFRSSLYMAGIDSDAHGLQTSGHRIVSQVSAKIFERACQESLAFGVWEAVVIVGKEMRSHDEWRLLVTVRGHP